MFFFFKQKTAYEMRISDWSSDVCSSDLMSLTPEELQARLDLAREINSSTPADKIDGAVASLIDLDAVPGVDDEFTFPARQTTSRDRIFGGQVSAQAMTAAARTVDPATPVNPLHPYFLRGVAGAQPLN